MLESLEKELDSCQLSDLFRLRKKYRDLVRRSANNKLSQEAIAAFSQSIKSSIAKCKTRDDGIPSKISFPEQLPVSAKTDEIVQLLHKHQVLVIAGDTGSGKTTQIPKMCLEAGFGRRGLIGHTQPRRLAAVSVADRIAEELAVEVGQGVGYQVRFNDQVDHSTFLKLMTDGILLAEIQRDRFLNRYEVLIIDEAHERSLNIDFLLGFLKQLLPKRPDLRLVITSATIDLQKFSQHFGNAPIVSVSGRTFPVITEYQPLHDSAEKDKERGNSDMLVDGVVEAVARLYSKAESSPHQHNDVLVFLASEREIRDTAAAFRKRRLPNVEVLPLYARLRHSEQVKIFRPHKGRRIVLSTNVAETSITVPGIRYVVDTGFARISRYSLQSKVQRLPIEAVSQASANQRQGRCGRLAEGVCVRLYSEDDFNSRPPYTDPEIRRTNLASVILRMRFLNLGDVDNFPFLEAPESKAINEGFKLLYELNALTPARELTAQGRQMAQLPIDPKYARMLIVAESRNCLREVLIIVSALSSQDPRETNAENKSAAQEVQQQFNHSDSDFLTFVNLWLGYEVQRQRLSQAQLRKYCKQHSLSFMRMREWREIHRQLLLSCQQLGWKLNSEPATYQSVHESIIAGSLNQIARKHEANQYLGNRNRKFKLLSSSVLGRRQVDWIVTGDLIETHQVFASMAAKIQPHWVEQMALHLVKREYFEPHWSKKRQQVMAYEKVQLYGLTLLEKSLIPFAEVDPVAAREVFVSEGLVGRQLRTRLAFYHTNLDFLDELAKQEEKIRRPDFILSDSDVARFYDERIPDNVLSTRQLESWYKALDDKAEAALSSVRGEAGTAYDKQSLLIEKSPLLRDNVGFNAFDQFPDKALVSQNPLSINYLFDPSDQRDGATIDIPQLLLGQMTQADVDWAVPGHIREKCILLIKGLPKATRKHFIPVSGFVDQVLPLISAQEGDLLNALISQIRNLKKLSLTASDFVSIDIPKHLQVKIRVLNESGDEIGFGHDLAQLKQDYATETESDVPGSNVSTSLHPLENERLVDWTISDLPHNVEVGDELKLIRYPALVDKQDYVSVKLFADELEATLVNRQGLMRLLMLRSVQQRNGIRKMGTRFLNSIALKMNGGHIVEVDELIESAYTEAFELDKECPRTKGEFDSLLNRGKPKLLLKAEAIQKLVLTIVDKVYEIKKCCRERQSKGISYAIEDIELQLSQLVYRGFLIDTPFVWLSQFPRYLQAIEQRLARAPHLGAKDKEATNELRGYWSKFVQLQQSVQMHDPAAVSMLRWMLEEYRVSLFAQALGTKVSVSAKRIQKQFELFN